MRIMERIKCLIIGSGPAGYTAAIYAVRANLSPVLYTGMELGGQLTTTSLVENFPGFPDGVNGAELLDRMKAQAENLGAKIRNGVVTKVDFSKRPFVLQIDGSQDIEAESVIIATGASARYLNIPGEEKYKGGGVSACAVCDGFFYRKKDVAVIGGGDTACSDALYLSEICNKVHLIIRRDVMRASKVLQERVLAKSNIEVHWLSQPLEVVGDGEGVTALKILDKPSASEKEIPVYGIFVAVGHTPNTEIFRPYLKLNEEGYILTEAGTAKTNIEGVFAAGDVQEIAYKQAINAAAGGCRAALEAEKYLQGV